MGLREADQPEIFSTLCAGYTRKPTPSIDSLGPSAGWRTASNPSSFIGSVPVLLKDEDKSSDFGKVILPFTVLLRLDCVQEATESEVLAEIIEKVDDLFKGEPQTTKSSSM